MLHIFNIYYYGKSELFKAEISIGIYFELVFNISITIKMGLHIKNELGYF